MTKKWNWTYLYTLLSYTVLTFNESTVSCKRWPIRSQLSNARFILGFLTNTVGFTRTLLHTPLLKKMVENTCKSENWNSLILACFALYNPERHSHICVISDHKKHQSRAKALNNFEGSKRFRPLFCNLLVFFFCNHIVSILRLWLPN